MSMNSLKRDLDAVTQAIHSVFVYAACTEDGFVKVGISRTPYHRIYQIHCGSPSPVRAAQWVWVGSLNFGRRIEQKVRKEWRSRHTRGEWYRFDYSDPADKRDFHDTLGAVVQAVTGKAPEWNKLNSQAMAELIKAGYSLHDDKEKRKRA
jgi:hypothetical protein